jgi:hypothetical protein
MKICSYHVITIRPDVWWIYSIWICQIGWTVISLNTRSGCTGRLFQTIVTCCTWLAVSHSTSTNGCPHCTDWTIYHLHSSCKRKFINLIRNRSLPVLYFIYRVFSLFIYFKVASHDLHLKESVQSCDNIKTSKLTFWAVMPGGTIYGIRLGSKIGHTVPTCGTFLVVSHVIF